MSYRIKITCKRLAYEEHIMQVEEDPTEQELEEFEDLVKDNLPDNVLNTNRVEVTEVEVIEENF